MAKRSIYSSEQSRWKALFARDKDAGGAFYYAVKSTGVFCRPGCSSRLPKRENVEFFDTGKEAVLAGYRPCKRCKPGSPSPQELRAELIVRACRRIEETETVPTLNQLAKDADLSPSHFHRVFKEVTGVTPKRYAATRQAQRFKRNLATSPSVTQAIYGAGYGSSSRAYESCGDRLAMTPSAYRRGAAGETIRYSVAQCFLGWVIVAATARGVCSIELGDEPDALPAQLQQRFPRAVIEEAASDFSAVVEKVVTFIEKPEDGVELPLDIQGTAFQERVWSALREIPLGTVVSYTDVAESIGSPKAVRAVAGACAANKLAVVVPCHRVVRSDGGLSGYRWGIARKQALLDRENPEKS